ncbi:putative ABC transporter permease [Oribacterium sp. HCP28S3_H8]|uniref:putative ABC transporter permease n=1 Tax=Oribacterium sp. HCP28S3_H8 TaxID=3438945 RepID=UPI003F8B0DE8
MMLSLYVIYFALFSFLGWVFECSYAMLRTRHWDNRGFLYGPVCPIYGVGAVLAIFLFGDLPHRLGMQVNLPEVFFVSFLGSAALELATSWGLEYFFHAVWWDYSDLPFNYRGRICLPASVLFGIGGMLIVKLVIPFLALMPLERYPEVNEAASLILMFMIGADVALTLASLTELVSRMEALQAEFDRRAEAGVVMMTQAPRVAMDTMGSAMESVGSAASAVRQTAVSTVGSAYKTAMETAGAAVDIIRKTAKRSEVLEDGNEENPDWDARLRSVSDGLTRREKYHLKSIVAFRSRGINTIAGNMRKLLVRNPVDAAQRADTENLKNMENKIV